jgi:hypothetical protein
MRLRRRVEITIQRRTLSRTDNPPVLALCPSCQCRVNMLPVEIAAKACGVSPRVVYRWVEQDRVHYSQLTDGVVLVCENSLPSQ